MYSTSGCRADVPMDEDLQNCQLLSLSRPSFMIIYGTIDPQWGDNHVSNKLSLTYLNIPVAETII